MDGTGGDCRRRPEISWITGDLMSPSIEKALAHNERNETVFGVLQRFLSKQPKNLFMGWGWVRKRAGSWINAGDRNGLEQKRILGVYLAEFGDGVFGLGIHKPASKPALLAANT